MTSPSPRKLPTTRSNGRATDAWLAAGLLAVCLLPQAAAAAGWQDFVRSPEEALWMPPPAGVDNEVVTAAGSADSAAECLACGAELEVVALAADAADEACTDEAEDCREELLRRQEDRLASIDLDIRVGGRPGNDYPCECRLEGETFEPRRFACTTFTWKAAGYCHKPLYFEDWQLERYGHSHGGLADPFLSAAHFFVTLPVLPYKVGVELPWECVYPLGYYRPGSCSPWMVPAVPISPRGFAVEAATITGILFVLP